MKTAKSRRGCINNPNLTYQADPREVKLRKIINGESNDMEDGVFPTICTEKKDGVQPEFDIRTDRFEVAIDAIDKITRKTTVMDRIHNRRKRNIRRICRRNALSVHVLKQSVRRR